MPEILIGKNLALESLMRAPLSPASRMIAKLAIDSVPVVDAEPVRHGRWIEENPKGSKHCRLVRCSECGFTVCLSMNVPLAYWAEDRCYCQKCGARMDGGADNG